MKLIDSAPSACQSYPNTSVMGTLGSFLNFPYFWHKTVLRPYKGLQIWYLSYCLFTVQCLLGRHFYMQQNLLFGNLNISLLNHLHHCCLPFLYQATVRMLFRLKLVMFYFLQTSMTKKFRAFLWVFITCFTLPIQSCLWSYFLPLNISSSSNVPILVSKPKNIKVS